MATSPQVVVIGAGVIGLTTAQFLCDAGYRVTILAEHLPGDSDVLYASPWAGAHWRTHASADEPEQCSWDLQTYQFWLDLMHKEVVDPERQRSGVKLFDSLHFWDDGITDDLWWAPHVRDFKRLPETAGQIQYINRHQDSDASKVSQGAICRAMAVNVPQYLSHLNNNLLELGVIFLQCTLPHSLGFEHALAAAENICSGADRGAVDCFVNATGLGARKLCGDTAVFPVRGQTVLVRGEAAAIRTRYSRTESGQQRLTYCIPRPGSGTTILGGTKEVDVWDAAPNPAATDVILREASRIAPELLTSNDGGFEVVSVQCGLRPARKGGPRTDAEIAAGRKVVHSYGFAGAGYQNSVGAARLVVRRVGELLGSDKPSKVTTEP